MNNGKTIYDTRAALDEAVRNAASELYVALKNLLDAVQERRGMPGIDSIESAVIADAESLVGRLRIKTPNASLEGLGAGLPAERPAGRLPDES